MRLKLPSVKEKAERQLKALTNTIAKKKITEDKENNYKIRWKSGKKVGC